MAIQSVRLDKQLSCDYLCGIIQKLVSQYQTQNGNALENCVLVMEIKLARDSTDTFIPKITHNKESSTQ